MSDNARPGTVLYRLVVLQVVVAFVAVAVTVMSVRQMRILFEEKENVAAAIQALQRQIAEQQAIIVKLRVERTEAERQRSAVVEQLLRSRNAAEHVRAGINHYQRGEYAAAIISYEEAIAIDPDNFVVYDWLAYAEYRNHRYEEARSSENRAIALEPSYARGYYNLALILWRLGRKADAIAALQRMAGLNAEMVGELREDGQFAPFRAVPEFRKLVNHP